MRRLGLGEPITDLTVLGRAVEPAVEPVVERALVGERALVQGEAERAARVVEDPGPVVPLLPSTVERTAPVTVARLVGDRPLQPALAADRTPGPEPVPAGDAVVQRTTVPAATVHVTSSAPAAPAPVPLLTPPAPTAQRAVHAPRMPVTLPTSVPSAAAMPAAPEVPRPSLPQLDALPSTDLPAPHLTPTAPGTPGPASGGTTTTATATAAPHPPAGPASEDADELVKKIFDPLLRRLKAELLMDRDRRGVLTDLRF